ncbi:MAG TPA: hypothetical protein VFB36_05880 [Nevskiaceae bacterium]|nr:hypothetical protein [Nevskiaceae bacterium]
MRSNLFCLAALAMATSAAVAADGQSAASDDQVFLEELTVVAPVAPLDRPLLFLRAITNALPCLGCQDPQGVERPPDEMSMLEFLLLPAEPAPQDRAAALARSVRYEGFGPDTGPR